MHENMLDIKALLLAKEARSGNDRLGMARIQLPKKPVKTRAQFLHELELKERATYRLR
mgnify:CR=1 FL=1|jgi:hypothetical protein